MRLSLEKEIRSAKDVSHVFVLTHNVDLIFLQNVLIPTLRKCGNPSITVFAEYSCAVESFSIYHKYAGGLGKRYRLVPVKMSKGFRFHPKAIFIAGKKKASLFIGSGNLGFGGWRDNGEIWSHYDTESGGKPEISSFYEYLIQIANDIPLSTTIISEIQSAYDPSTHMWSLNLPASQGLLGKFKQGESLLDRMETYLAGKSISKLVICAPYFDDRGEIINSLHAFAQEAPVEVLVPSYGSNISLDVMKNLSSRVKFTTVTFRKSDDHESFVHAKFYAFVHTDEITLFSGSANCSAAALSISGAQGNAELLSVRQISVQNFINEVLGEIEVVNAAPRLSEVQEHKEPEPDHGRISILAARNDRNGLAITVSMTEGISIKQVLLDDEAVTYTETPDFLLVARANIICSRIQVIGIFQGSNLHSDLFWIDHEIELQKTGKHRSLAGAVHQGISPEGWSLSSWNTILGIFVEHLQYLPQKSNIPRKSGDRNKKEIATTFTESDVFISDYGTLRETSKTAGAHKISGLRSLLLQLFGYYDYERPEENEDIPPDGEGEGKERKAKFHGDEGDNGDDPDPDPDPPDPEVIPTRHNRKQSYKHLTEAVDTICSMEYYLNRPIDQISHDITLLSPLLRFSKSEGLISELQFLEISQKLWSTMFFNYLYVDSSEKRWHGWFDYRTTTEGEHFIETFRDIKTAASLISWAISPDFENPTPDMSIFMISSAMAFAKYPWLCSGHETNELDAFIYDDLVLMKQIDPDNIEDWTIKAKKWNTLRSMGQTFLILQDELQAISPAHCKDKIECETVELGKLVWLGKKRGFGVLLEPCNRTYIGKKVSVHCMQTMEKDLKWSSDYILPIESLIASGLILRTKTETEKKDIVKTLNHVGSTVIEIDV